MHRLGPPHRALVIRVALGSVVAFSGAVLPLLAQRAVATPVLAVPPVASLVSGQAPSSAIRLEPNSDVQAAVDAYPDGTAFLLTAGLYAGFSVVPKDADRFYAQPGATLDGGHRLPSAFKVPSGASVDGVQVVGASLHEPLVIQNYGTHSHSQIGAIQTSSQSAGGSVSSNGWRLQWIEVTGNAARAVSLSNHMLVMECDITNNGRLGLGGGGTGVTIADNTIADNGIGVSQKGWEAGGIKTVAHNALIENNTISANGAPGIWTDVGATDVRISGNRLDANLYGVQVEISHNVAVIRNSISGSTYHAVLVVGSAGVQVTDNTISRNFRGIIVGGVTRVGPGGIHLSHVTVSGNTVVDSGASGLHQAVPPGTEIRFDRDHYVNERFQWNGQRVTFAQLQALGQERHGTSRQ